MNLKRKDILLKKLNYESSLINNSTKNIVISIVGISNGVGTTRIATKLAYDLLQKCEKVALLEFNKSTDLENLEEDDFKITDKGQIDIYSYHELSIDKVIEKDIYNVILCDFGDYFNINCNEDILALHNSSIKAVVINLVSWKQRYLERFLKDIDIEEWSYIVNLVNDSDYLKLLKDFRSVDRNIKVFKFEFLENNDKNQAIAGWLLD